MPSIIGAHAGARLPPPDTPLTWADHLERLTDDRPCRVDDTDHATELLAAIRRLEELDTVMTDLEQKRDRLLNRLDDPDLLEVYPADHPHRIDAEDLIDRLDADLAVRRYELASLADAINQHGTSLLDRIPPIADSARQRVNRMCRGIQTTATWQVVNGSPF